MSEPIHIISLGAGVQSYCMFLRASLGDITPRPQAAVFANTDWELPETLDLVKRLQSEQRAIPVFIVGKSSLREKAMNCTNKTWWPGIPVYTRSGSKEGKLRRKCTTTFKVSLLESFSKRMLKESNSIDLVQWKGITTDEIYRMKPSRKAWYSIRWPLIELGMSRHDCEVWLTKNGFPIPSRSACIGCPYHSDSYWGWLKRERPVQFKEAVDFDSRIRCGVKGLREEAFVHRSLVPLDQIDFSTEEERGQLNMFNNECEGMCGV